MGAMTAHPLRVRWALAAVGLWVGLGLTLAGCGHSGASRGSSTAGPSTTVPAAAPTPPATTAPPATAPPTTAWKPAAPQASADAAAAVLVDAWGAADRATAASVAAPEAVTALFAVPYPGSGLAIDRGCSTTAPPVVCTYGPPGGASPSDAIYQLTVSEAPAGWYVSSVQVLG
jgi:hypothetical protein